MPSSTLGLLGLMVTLSAKTALCQTSFDWTTITPSEDLEWNDCHGIYKCARLEVPYEYDNEAESRTMAIAMQMLPAVVSVDDPKHGGSIFINPGGPGHPGTEFVMSSGRHLQLTFDKEGERHYDIIGWDPRGIGNTTPRVKCLEDVFDRDAFFLELRGTHTYGYNRDSVAYMLAMHETLALKCKWQADNGNIDIFEHVSTTLVVQDLVRMVDKLDDERKETKRKRGLTVHRRCNETGNGPARLQYYGVSYGSVLGNFFASMYPGRVGRMVLDGVADVQDYLAERGWLTPTKDTDKLYREFLSGCFDIGPACPLYLESDTSPDDIHTRIWDPIESLNARPRGSITLTGQRTTITGRDVLTYVGLFAYSPVGGWQLLARLLASVVAGDHTLLNSFRDALHDLPKFKEGCTAPETGMESVPDFLMAVMCSEAEPVNDKDVDWWVDYMQEQEEITETYGHIMGNIKMSCSSYPYRSVRNFQGPFTSPEADPDISDGKPAAPLLFLTTRLDPVTPAESARAMAATHPGSGLVMQNSLGHGTTLVAPSNCTDQIVRDYFDEGIVPAEETVCEQDCGPWDPGCNPDKTLEGASISERSDAFNEAALLMFSRRNPFRFMY